MPPTAKAIIAGIAVFIVCKIALGYALGPAVCRDGWASPSIGKRGACSHHRGVSPTKGILSFLGAAVAGLGVGFWLWPKVPRPGNVSGRTISGNSTAPRPSQPPASSPRTLESPTPPTPPAPMPTTKTKPLAYSWPWPPRSSSPPPQPSALPLAPSPKSSRLVQMELPLGETQKTEGNPVTTTRPSSKSRSHRRYRMRH